MKNKYRARRPGGLLLDRIRRCGFLVLLTAAAGLLPSPVGAQPSSPGVNPELLRRPWDAHWISHPEASRTDFGVFHFRRVFALDRVPASFVVHVSADNRYKLYVNGKPVVRGPARGDLENWRFETVDLAPYLQAGDNVLAAVVWNYAELRPVAQVTYQTAFVLQGDTEREAAVNTGSRWKVYRNPGYRLIPVDRASMGYPYIVVGPGERLEARVYPWGWEGPAFSDADWPAALELKQAVPKWGHHFDIYIGWQLVPRMIPLMEERLQRIPEIARARGLEAHDGFLRGTADLVVPAHTTAEILLDQTYLTTGYPELVVSGGAGSTVTFTYAEALFDDSLRKGHRDVIEGKTIRGYQDQFLPDGGARRTFQPLWWRTFRYLQLDVETGDEPLVLHDLHALFTAYPFEERAAFASSDTTLGAIWNVGWRTARLCAGETYFDCPYYEQLQYVGDTRIQALISLYVAGDDRLMRKAIEAFHNSRVPDGLTESRYPAWEPQYIPPYSLFWIVMLYDHWMHRDDPDFVAKYLNGVRGVIDWYAGYVDETGMLGPMPGWNFVDWSYRGGTHLSGVPPGADGGHSAVVTLQYIYALEAAAQMAEAFGRHDEAASYGRLAGSLKETTYRHCWDEGRGLLADTPEQEVFSQHANVMAVLVDLIPPAAQRAVMERVLEDPSLVPCTYYYRFYLTQAMLKAGLGDAYVPRLGPWREMLALGLTTFAETPEPTRSDCHAWSASPNYDFLATVCGIRPAAAGFRSVQIQPHLGPLSWVQGRMPHPLGEIEVHLRRLGEAGLQGEVTLPEGLHGTLLWNGRTVALTGGTQAVSL